MVGGRGLHAVTPGITAPRFKLAAGEHAGAFGSASPGGVRVYLWWNFMPVRPSGDTQKMPGFRAKDFEMPFI